MRSAEKGRFLISVAETVEEMVRRWRERLSDENEKPIQFAQEEDDPSSRGAPAISLEQPGQPLQEGNAIAVSRAAALTSTPAVTDVTAPRLEQARADIMVTIESGNEIWLRTRPLIAAVERDIRLNLRPPFPRKVADDLSSFMRTILDHIVQDLADGLATLKRPVTTPVKFRWLQEEGEEILDDIEPYARLADHYYTRYSPDWSTDKVARELSELSNRASILKRRIINYLQVLNEFLGELNI